MAKIQQFFIKNRKQIVTLTTIMLVFAEIFHFLISRPIVYQAIMVTVAIIGVIPIFLTALSSLRLRIISIDVLVTIAVIGAFMIGEFNEAAIVTWLFILGEVLEEITLHKTRSAVSELAKIAPKKATIITENNNFEEKDIELVNPGTRVLIKTGSQVPIDGKILTGNAVLNEASVTGEARPVSKKKGDSVYAGTLLEDGTITVETTAAGEDTTFGKIIELIEEAQDSKNNTQRFIDHFAKYYTPIILIMAILIGIITHDFRLAITVMVLGCPGALVIGVPASTVAGIGNGTKHGILFKSSEVMNQIRHLDMIAFDKTGTLTLGRPEVNEVQVLKGNQQTIINLAISIEANANHPLAKAITKLKPSTTISVDKIKTIKGKGIIANIKEQKYLLGNLALLQDYQLLSAELKTAVNELTNQGNSIIIFASTDGLQLAIFAIKDQLRPDAKSALNQLKSLGIKNLVMLTGDNQTTAHKIAKELPLNEVFAEMLPDDKARFIKKQRQLGHKIAFIGDGINDSPALSQADVAVAMGSGADIAMDVSDLVLVKSSLTSLVTSFKLAKTTINNMKQNILIALLTVILLFIGLFTGYIKMASGMMIHELSILIVIINAMRLIHFSSKN